MENNEDLWENLVEKVSPVTVPEDSIEEITISIKEGGIEAMTSKPSAFTMFRTDSEGESDNTTGISLESVNNTEDRKSNENVFVYEDTGLHLKNRILRTLSDAVIDSPILSNYSLHKCRVTKEEIHPVFEFTHRTTEDWIKNRLAQSLSEEGRIDSASDLAFGSIDTVYRSQTEPFDGWDFDGTLYRYTDKPFEYWSEPDDMKEWVDFAADSERMEQVIQDRESHLIHFHPMKTQIGSNHPYIQWFKDVETQSLSSYQIDSKMVQSFSLVEVSVDDTGALLRNSLVI